MTQVQGTNFMYMYWVLT